ncbi:hypothetical protein MRX96_043139 [Rhipicephalus microplus]
MAANGHGTMIICGWSEYSGHSHTDPPDAPSVKPAGPVDAAGAATSYAPTETTGTPATTAGFRLGNSRAYVSPVIRVVVQARRRTPRSQGPFLRFHFTAAWECGKQLCVMCPTNQAEFCASPL